MVIILVRWGILGVFRNIWNYLELVRHFARQSSNWSETLRSNKLLKALASLRTCINSSFCKISGNEQLFIRVCDALFKQNWHDKKPWKITTNTLKLDDQVVLTFTGFMQHETQNSKVVQHPVEFLHPLQLNLKLDVELVSQQPVDKTLFLLQTNPKMWERDV